MTDLSRLVTALRGQVVPAVATPMDVEGTVRYAALESYAASMARFPVGGFAVWAHTGRGLWLSQPDRLRVLAAWRAATDLPLVVGAGVPAGATDPADPVRSARDETVQMAVEAADMGADAVMVYPSAAFAELPDREARTVALHERVAAETGLPLVGLYLHGEAGGYPYSAALLRDLLALPGMVGVRVATLDRAIGCQDAIRAMRSSGPSRLAITGEDRMFGPSLMWGAQAALVGIAAAAVPLSVNLVSAWTAGDTAGFLEASNRLDRFAAATFLDPMEGYVQRMLWAAVWDGLLPEEAAHDPYGPRLPATERDAVLACLDALARSTPDT